jgi:hypothetical protein
MNAPRAGGPVPGDGHEDSGGVLSLLIKKLFTGTTPGSWTPVLQLATLIMVIGGVISFVYHVMSGGSLGTGRTWGLVVVGALGCLIAFAVARRFSTWRTKRRLERQERAKALRAARRQSPPVKPATPLPRDTTEQPSQKDGQNQP